ncbi:phosphotransferase family protein [Stackebrandtia nassauensis]|uniref:Aminoglycoside phosphotransferase n=1 Tax=Stackebrandtia nassauensis (strain DSM 44728 / CIP 108903 / NRRL B-16338 / NBRC 102104 / LLR-40K-21) TaxID=446470 RepID=D3Q5J5_STANL|nr:aminoglycoside phosphotransferase family protein [Stackebrandtia nassauensis]ADD46055.1 aminoglycoside phosphotransferase [Stackebrandtia nassauensis DSM 44728]
MRSDEASRFLAELGIADDSVTPITGGWASWTFATGSGRILRVARNPEIDAAHRRESRLLPELAEAVSFAVPAPTHFGVHKGMTYMVYPRLPGRGLEPGDRVRAVAPMLAELHAFPVDRAAELLGCAVTAEAWRDDYLEIGKWVEGEVLPVLDGELRDRVRREYDATLPDLAAISPALIHRDLGCEHILTDPETGMPTGIIDFETATVGDPAIDYVGLLVTFGEQVTRELIAASGSEISWRLVRFYHWLGAAHAVKYGLAERDDAIVADGIEGLRRRLPG